MIRSIAAKAALFALFLPGVAAAQSREPRQLRIVWAHDPARHAIVSWSTNGPRRVNKVYYDTVRRNGAISAYAFQVNSGANGSYNGGSLNYHHATLSGLRPSTVYHFVVVSDGRASPERHFVTGPADDRPFKLLYGGDSRSNHSSRRGMNRRIAALVKGDSAILGLWHGGDYIARGSNLNQWSAWLDDHQLTITNTGRVLPIIPARGNHEGNGVLYNKVFAWPGGKRVDYFTTRMGSNTVLVTLDSNSAQGGTQRAWLNQTLQQAQSSRWILVNYHRPAFPAVKRPGGALQHWVPLFERYNVDLVCESDGHVLKRTVPIRNGRQHPTGIVYVGEGGLGVSQRSPYTNRWYLRGSGMARSGHHVQTLAFTPRQVVYKAVLLDGSVADTYVARPRRRSPGGPPPGGPQTNLALGKPTRSSSVYRLGTRDLGPAAAVDGNTIGNISDLFHTASNDRNPWFLVNLGGSYDIDRIVIHNRDSYKSRLRDITIEILDASGRVLAVYRNLNKGNRLRSPSILTHSISHRAKVVGSQVRVRRTPDPAASGDEANVLAFSELKVFKRTK